MNDQVKPPYPEVTRVGFLSLQVCVPQHYSDEEVEAFANADRPAGTSHGWKVRKEGDLKLAGDHERVPCNEREGCVHVMLDC